MKSRRVREGDIIRARCPDCNKSGITQMAELWKEVENSENGRVIFSLARNVICCGCGKHYPLVVLPTTSTIKSRSMPTGVLFRQS